MAAGGQSPEPRTPARLLLQGAKPRSQPQAGAPAPRQTQAGTRLWCTCGRRSSSSSVAAAGTAWPEMAPAARARSESSRTRTAASRCFSSAMRACAPQSPVGPLLAPPGGSSRCRGQACAGLRRRTVVTACRDAQLFVPRRITHTYIGDAAASGALQASNKRSPPRPDTLPPGASLQRGAPAWQRRAPSGARRPGRARARAASAAGRRCRCAAAGGTRSATSACGTARPGSAPRRAPQPSADGSSACKEPLRHGPQQGANAVCNETDCTCTGTLVGHPPCYTRWWGCWRGAGTQPHPCFAQRVCQMRHCARGPWCGAPLARTFVTRSSMRVPM